jgi:hypothetical protein
MHSYAARRSARDSRPAESAGARRAARAWRAMRSCLAQASMLACLSAPSWQRSRYGCMGTIFLPSFSGFTCSAPDRGTSRTALLFAMQLWSAAATAALLVTPAMVSVKKECGRPGKRTAPSEHNDSRYASKTTYPAC